MTKFSYLGCLPPGPLDYDPSSAFSKNIFSKKD